MAGGAAAGIFKGTARPLTKSAPKIAKTQKSEAARATRVKPKKSVRRSRAGQ